MIGTGTERTTPGNPPLLHALSGWCFVVFAAVALGYGAWGAFGSGESVASFDVHPEGTLARASIPNRAGGCPTFGPFALDPHQNPFRALLRTGFAPIGAERIAYQAALVDEDGRTVWDRRGRLGARDAEASFVRDQANLMEFEIDRGGRYTLEVRFDDESLDDLKEATLEVRGGFLRLDPRVPWGFGLAAVACLVVHLIVSRRPASTWAEDAEEDEEYREAA